MNNRINTKNVEVPYLDLDGLISPDRKRYLFHFDGYFYVSNKEDMIGLRYIPNKGYNKGYGSIPSFLETLDYREVKNPELYRAISDFLQLLKDKGIFE